MRRLPAIAVSALVVCGSALAAAATPAHAAPVICEKFGSTSVQSGRYIVQNNVWGADTQQCVDVNQNGGFTVTTANHNNATNGAPAAYPSIYAGCHYANCSGGSGLPMQASSGQFGSIQTSVGMSYPSGGTWNAAYDLWFDPTPRTDGQNTGAEIMIWLNRQGSIQPIGSQVATVNLLGATWNVWFGNIGWNVVSYVRTSATGSLSFAVDTFYGDAVGRGYAQRSWYLTSVQAGFEPWIGGAGLAVNSFSYGVGGGGGGDTTPPSTPQNLAATGVTANSATLSWSPSTDNVGVEGYTVFRRQGTSGTFTQVGTPSGTSFTSSGLAASTQYQFYVLARDAAGNPSGQSNTVTVTTQSGGGGGGGASCRVSYVPNTWPGGFTANVTITNTGPATVNAWTLTFAFPGSQQVTNAWNATVTQSGAAVTARNVGYNGTIAPNANASFGFQGTYGGSNSSPTAFGLNGSACTVG
jgi:hypothetical protein